MQVSTPSERILWIDLAKSYGMVLVFYAHFIERWVLTFHNNATLLQYKFIYSFHMPLFFILSGYVSSSIMPEAKSFIAKQLDKRFAPVLLFSLLIIPFWLSFVNYDGLNLNVRTFSFMFVRTLFSGQPMFNKLMWFVICLMMIESIDYVIIRYIDSRYYYYFPIVLLVLGFLVISKIDFITTSTGVMKNFWFIHESLVAFWFYAIGKLLKNMRFINITSYTYRILLICFFLSLTLLTYNLNDIQAVIMAFSRHGNPILFIITALSGSLTVIFLASITPDISALKFIGKNSLFFMGINSIYCEFFNHKIIEYFVSNVSYNLTYITIFSCLITFLCLISCYPIVLVLNNIFPKVISMPRLVMTNILTAILRPTS